MAGTSSPAVAARQFGILPFLCFVAKVWAFVASGFPEPTEKRHAPQRKRAFFVQYGLFDVFLTSANVHLSLLRREDEASVEVVAGI